MFACKKNLRTKYTTLQKFKFEISTDFNRSDRRGVPNVIHVPLLLTWFSVVGMMSGVCGSIVAGVLSFASTPRVRAIYRHTRSLRSATRNREKNTLTRHTMGSITGRTTVRPPLTLPLSSSVLTAWFPPL